MSGALATFSQYPGAPQLANAIVGATGSPIVLELADALGIQNILTSAQWGLYASGGALAIEADSVVEVDYANDDNVPTYPIEGGDFLAYNKVQGPYSLKVTFALSGTFKVSSLIAAAQAGNIKAAFSSLSGSAARAKFITTLDTLEHSLDLLTLVTPDASYPNVNVVHHEFTRSARTGTLINAIVWLNEIRTGASKTYSNTATPAAADPKSTGTATPVPYTSTPLPAPN